MTFQIHTEFILGVIQGNSVQVILVSSGEQNLPAWLGEMRVSFPLLSLPFL